MENQRLIRQALLRRHAGPPCLGGYGAAGGSEANRLIMFDNPEDGWTKDKNCISIAFCLNAKLLIFRNFASSSLWPMHNPG
jgi:hypothetical protein